MWSVSENSTGYEFLTLEGRVPSFSEHVHKSNPIFSIYITSDIRLEWLPHYLYLC